MGIERITTAWERCRAYMEAMDYRGYDPYDALCSPVWQASALRFRLLRRAGQQLVLRSPFNLRPLLRVPPGRNPVTLALALEGYVYAQQSFPEKAPLWEERIRRCLAELQRLRSPGWQAAWGYDFPWEARRMSLPAYAPTIVATGMVTSALFRTARLAGIRTAAELCLEAAEELLERFPRSYDDGTLLCWAYSPFDAQRVLNATLMGTRLCAHAYALSGRADFLEPARRSARFVLAHQQPSGAFPYAAGDDPRRWVDHLHTGYVLECLWEYWRITGDETVCEGLQRGWRYYRRALFTAEGIPRWSDRRRYPVDASACAQAIRTLCRFGELRAALQVAQWAVEHLQHADGSFAYRRYRFWTQHTVFMRWSVAWMFVALAELIRSHTLGTHALLD